MKKLLFVVLSLFISGVTFSQSNEIWLEMDPAPLETVVSGDRAGTDVKVEITCSNESVSELIIEARKIALYKLIVDGYDQSEDGRASAIPRLISEKSIYDQKKDFFIDYINNESKGLQYAQGKINMSKPAGEFKDGRKKLKKASVIVTLRIEQIKKDLEAQGLVTSNKKLAEILKYKPRIIIRPSDAWLEKLGAKRIENNQNQTVIIREYEKVLSNKNFGIISSTISKSIGEGFEVISIAEKLNEISNGKVNDQLSSYGLSESSEDLMARTLNADLYLDVFYEEESISGGMETQFNLQLTGKNGATGTDVDKLIGNLISKRSSGDNNTQLLMSTLKSATNDFINGVSEFLSERINDGMPCSMEFRIAKDLEGEKTFNGFVKGKKFKMLIDESVKELSLTGDKVGSDSPTMLSYSVKIPALIQTANGKSTANSVENFAEKVYEDMSNKLEGFFMITQSIGKGKVIVVFTKVEPK